MSDPNYDSAERKSLIEPEGIECPDDPNLHTCYYEMDCEHASMCDNCNELICGENKGIHDDSECEPEDG